MAASSASVHSPSSGRRVARRCSRSSAWRRPRSGPATGRPPADAGVFIRAADFTGMSGVTLKRPSSASPPHRVGAGATRSPRTAACSPSVERSVHGIGRRTQAEQAYRRIGALPDNDGYDLLASDGGIFSYGPAANSTAPWAARRSTSPSSGSRRPVRRRLLGGRVRRRHVLLQRTFLGSMGGKPLNKPIVGCGGAGQRLLPRGLGRRVFAFGTGVYFQGSTGALKLVHRSWGCPWADRGQTQPFHEGASPASSPGVLRSGPLGGALFSPPPAGRPAPRPAVRR